MELSRARDEERTKVSRDLHDQAGQILTALRFELDGVENADGNAAQPLAEAQHLAADALRIVREIARGLRPPALDALGLTPALAAEAREFSRRTGVMVDFQLQGSIPELHDGARICAFRVVQEALTNCARHASASRIEVTVQGWPATVTVTVEDNGVGFDVPMVRRTGLGLLGAEERIKELGGWMTISSRVSKGTRLQFEIPACPASTVEPAPFGPRKAKPIESAGACANQPVPGG